VKIVKTVLVVIALMGLGYFGVTFYSFLFARKVNGVVVDVEKVEMTNAVLTRSTNDLPYMHSFAVAVKEASGEIITSSAEDRQWAVVKEGQCVEAKFFPYPPWDFVKSGTYFGARLLKLSDCSSVSPQENK
jgi:hypothetical protein